MSDLVQVNPLRSVDLTRCVALLLSLLGTVGRPVLAQRISPPVPVNQAPLDVDVPGVGHVVLTATMRSRAESWDWFDTGENGRYTFGAGLLKVSASQQRGRFSWKSEVAAVQFVGLPATAIQSAPAGQLGLGGTYRASNDGARDPGVVFLRQLNAAWTTPMLALRAGRFEFSDGVERNVSSPALATLKAQRVGQRLIGPFAFTHVQRSLDGVSLRLGENGGTQLHAVAFQPTGGAFSTLAAGDRLPVDVAYTAATTGGTWHGGEWDARLFGLLYRDRRSVTPADARPQIEREANRRIRTMTYGAHWAHVQPAGSLLFDGLLWGALQRGAWGSLDHRAHAVAIEGGAQLPRAPWSPWLRLGHYVGSGDPNATDAQHNTFFAVLPTPRLYARLPFFNGMNSRESFVMLMVKPRKTITSRGGAHAVSLAQSADLWYIGGGAFDPKAFGFPARPSGGQTELATLADLSVEWRVRPWLEVQGYVARASAGRVPTAVYGQALPTRFAYLEFSLLR